MLVKPEWLPLHRALWARQTAALRRASQEAAATAAQARAAASQHLDDLPDQPPWVCQDTYLLHGN